MIFRMRFLDLIAHHARDNSSSFLTAGRETSSRPSVDSKAADMTVDTETAWGSRNTRPSSMSPLSHNSRIDIFPYEVDRSAVLNSRADFDLMKTAGAASKALA